MTTILDNIIEEKKKVVADLRNQTFEQTTAPYTGQPFSEIVRANQSMAMIAEIKRASPSKGMINKHVDPVIQAQQYEKYGASAISILTDTPFFKGTMQDLLQVRKAVNIPILCKDFIIDRVQIDQAVASGANMILLIAAALDNDQMHDLYHYAISKHAEVLCEVHNEEEMERVLQLKPTLIGINNRNLKTFKVDLHTTARLANMVEDPDVIIISESGIQTKLDVKQLSISGAEAILIGETLMRSESLEDIMNTIQIPLPNKVRRVR